MRLFFSQLFDVCLFSNVSSDGVVLIEPDYFNKEGKQDRKGERKWEKEGVKEGGWG